MNVGDRILHLPSGDIIEITKVNQKTYTGKSLVAHKAAKQVRANKADCVPHEGDIPEQKESAKPKPSERDPQAMNKQIAERLSYFNKQMGL